MGATEVEWERTYGGVGHDWGLAACRLLDGGYILVGKSTSYAENHVLVIAVDSLGRIRWTHAFGHEGGYQDGNAVCVRPDGSFLVVVSGTTNQGFENCLVQKYNNNGDVIWSRTYGEGGDGLRLWCTSLVSTDDGGFILAGYQEIINTSSRFWVVKITADGEPQWDHIYEELPGRCNNLIQLRDSDYVLSGVSIGNNNYCPCVARISLFGDGIWSRSYDAVAYPSSGYVVEANDKRILLLSSVYGS